MSRWTNTGAPDEPCVAAMARVYLRMGWAVFPLWWASGGACACPEGASCTSPAKHPLTPRGVHDASRDPEQVAFWWGSCWPRANLGLPAGANGLAVLDVDAGHGGYESLARLQDDLLARGLPLPTTKAAVTGSGGLHLFFAAPEAGVKTGANVFGPEAAGLDTRGRGGYVVAAPSVHATGGTYKWLNFIGAESAPWPSVLTDLMSVAEGR